MKKFNERFLFQTFSSLQIFPLSFWCFFFQKIKSYISFNKTTYTLYFFKFLIEIQRIDSSIYCQKKNRKKDFLFYREAKKKIRLEDQKRKCKRDKKLVSPGSNRWSSNARPRKKKKKKRDSADGKVRRRVV